MDFQTVLVISPHTDDAELGAGGTINRFVKLGKEIYYIAFSMTPAIIRPRCSVVAEALSAIPKILPCC